MPPKISVIITSYNRKHLISETIDSFLNQTLKPYEIIVVDNNSQDDSYEYVSEKYKDEAIAISYKDKQSPGAARNKGFEIATGDYIQFFDSDDVLTKNKLKVQAAIMQQQNEQCIYSPYIYGKKDKHTWIPQSPVIQYHPLKQKLHNAMPKGFFTIIPGFLFTKELIKEIGKWREDIIAYEDWDYLWRIGTIIPKPYHTNECAVIYRVHKNQITTGMRSDFNRDLDKLSCIKSIKNNTYNQLTKKKILILEAEMYKVLKINNKLSLAKHYFFKNSSEKLKILQLYIRLLNKINRLATQSDYQIYHGINKDPAIFQKYFNLL